MIITQLLGLKPWSVKSSISIQIENSGMDSITLSCLCIKEKSVYKIFSLGTCCNFHCCCCSSWRFHCVICTCQVVTMKSSFLFILHKFEQAKLTRFSLHLLLLYLLIANFIVQHFHLQFSVIFTLSCSVLFLYLFRVICHLL